MTDAIDHIIDSMDGIVFMTSGDGTILSIGKRNWNRFALENDGAARGIGRQVQASLPSYSAQQLGVS